MALRSCRWPGCAELVDTTTYCAEHERDVEEIRRPKGHRRLYGTKRWRRQSRAFLRQHPFCVCGCGELATVVDHIVPVEDGGAFWDSTNWQPMAKRCHDRKTATDVRTRTHSYTEA